MYKRQVNSTSSVPSVVFGTVENNTEWLYALYEKSKVAVGEQGAYNEGQLWDDIGFSADDLPYQMYKTVVKVNGQPYDAETFTNSDGKYTCLLYTSDACRRQRCSLHAFLV